MDMPGILTTLVERVPQGLGVFHLPVSETISRHEQGEVSPYFQVKRPMRKVGTGRDEQFTLSHMAKKAAVHYFSNFYDDPVRRPVTVQWWETTTGLLTDSHDFEINMISYPGGEAFWNELASQVVAYATGTLGYSGFAEGDIEWAQEARLPDALSQAPLAAVADAPTDAPNDAVTNYNVVSTLLGTLVGAVNTANAKQNAIADNANEIATQLNALLARVRTLELINT